MPNTPDTMQAAVTLCLIERPMTRSQIEAHLVAMMLPRFDAHGFQLLETSGDVYTVTWGGAAPEFVGNVELASCIAWAGRDDLRDTYVKFNTRSKAKYIKLMLHEMKRLQKSKCGISR